MNRTSDASDDSSLSRACVRFRSPRRIDPCAGSSAMYSLPYRPGVGFLNGRLLTADVTNTVSPHTIGDDQPCPAIGHRPLDVLGRGPSIRDTRRRGHAAHLVSAETRPGLLRPGRAARRHVTARLDNERNATDGTVSLHAHLRLSKTNRVVSRHDPDLVQTLNRRRGRERHHVVGVDAGLRRALPFPRRVHDHDQAAGLERRCQMPCNSSPACCSRLSVSTSTMASTDASVQAGAVAQA